MRRALPYLLFGAISLACFWRFVFLGWTLYDVRTLESQLGTRAADFPEAMFYELGGVPTCRIVEILNERHGYDMHVEETANAATLWAHYTDAELHVVHERLLATLAPEEHLVMARWLVPASNPAELESIPEHLREHAFQLRPVWQRFLVVLADRSPTSFSRSSSSRPFS